MHLLVLCGCLALVAAAPPPVSPTGGEGAEAAFTPRHQELLTPDEYQDDLEYQDALTRVPVLLLTPENLDDLLNEMEYQYGDGDLDITFHQGYDYELLNGDSQEQGEDEEQASKEEVVGRSKRQVAQEAMNLALSHTDHNGNNRPAGRVWNIRLSKSIK